jgi:hypothetical protein
VYSRGLEYCAANLLGTTYELPAPIAAPHDWGVEDELFSTRIPDSTQQILTLDIHGDLRAVDPALRVGLRDVPSTLANRLELVDWDTLGEWFVYLLLLPIELDGSIADAAALAAGWDGDTVLFAREIETEQTISLWTSAWEDEQTAAAMVAAMRALYGAQEPTQGWVSQAQDGELVWIEQRGTRLVAAKNIPADIAPDLVEAAFSTSGAAARRLRPSLGAMLEGSREFHRDRIRRVMPRGDNQ